MTMINHILTDRYGPEWSSFYNTEDFLDYLYKVDDQVLVGSEHLDWGYTEGGKPYNQVGVGDRVCKGLVEINLLQ